MREGGKGRKAVDDNISRAELIANIDQLPTEKLLSMLDRNRYGIARYPAREELDKRLSHKDVSLLIATLRHPLNLTRSYAIEKLTVFGDETIIEPLLEALFDSRLKDSGGIAAFATVEALVRMGGKTLLPEFTQRFENEKNLYFRLAAAFGLAKLGDYRGLSLLIENLGNKENGYDRMSRYILTAVGTAAVPILITNFKSSRGSKRISIASILGEIGDSRAIEPLVAALEKSNKKDRLSLALDLADLNSVEAVAPLMDFFKSPNENQDIRHSAVYGLKIWIRHHNNLSPQLFIEVMNEDKNIYIRREAMKILASIGNPEALEPLIAILKNLELDEVDEYLRPEAAESLGSLGDKRAIEPLIEALSDKVRRVRARAADALGKIGDERAIDKLRWLKQNDPEVQQYRDIAGEAIAKIEKRLSKQRDWKEA